MKSFYDFSIDIPHHASGEIQTTCPQCSRERKKKNARCLSVNADKGCWICHHCGWKGSLQTGVEGRDQWHWRKPKFSTPPSIKLDLPDPTIAWFESRGITKQVLKRNQIGFAQAYMPQTEETENCVTFPFFRNQKLINRKYRSNGKNFRLEAGCELIPMGLDDIENADHVIWVEGEIDKLSIEVAGFKTCVSVPNGAPPPNAKTVDLSFLDGMDLENKTHTIAVDSDEPGQRLELELSRRLGKENCRKLIWPDTIKDANEMLVEFGSDALRAAVSDAAPYPVNGIHNIQTLHDGLLRRFQGDVERGVSVGWNRVSRHFTPRPGEWTVVTGIPSSGKSNFLDCMCINIARIHGWKFGMFSPENQPLDLHCANLVEKFIGKSFDEHSMTREELKRGEDFIAKHFHHILPALDDEWTIDNVLRLAKVLIRREGIRGLVIDPWNEIDAQIPQHQNEVQYISQALTKIRRFSREYGIHTFVVAHPAKLQKNKDGSYPVPTPYDIAGAAHWRNKADNCITVYRHFSVSGSEPRPIEVHVQKIRFRDVGKIGMIPMTFVPESATYKEFVA